jgi:MFS family permease
LIRIFSSLAVFAILCVIGALLLGIFVGNLQAVARSGVPDAVRRESVERAAAHLLAGLAAALVVILVNSISLTYFIGTSRWCKEVVERYALDIALVRRSVAIKRRTFPWAVSSMLAIMVVVVLGAAADPATGMEHTADWVVPHYLAALAALAFLAFSFFVQASKIRQHYDVINDILAEVRRVRAQRGLDV